MSVAASETGPPQNCGHSLLDRADFTDARQDALRRIPPDGPTLVFTIPPAAIAHQDSKGHASRRLGSLNRWAVAHLLLAVAVRGHREEANPAQRASCSTPPESRPLLDPTSRHERRVEPVPRSSHYSYR